MTAARNPAPAYSGLPSLEQLLVDGGDARIAPNTEGVNKYGCPPFPDPELIALGSSTASGISESGYAAAARLLNRLQHDLESSPDTLVYQREIAQMRQELAGLCELPRLAGMEIIFTASGTDAHLIAAGLIRTGATPPPLAIMVEAAESGSGVPAALSGQTPGSSMVEVANVRIRLADGAPRPAADIDAGFDTLASQAAAQGRRVMLVLTDVSKTGMVAPSPACAISLARKFPDQMDVLVDACQFRISPATLHAYLEQGFMVALTGSKFVSGPPFSGALLVPPRLASRFRTQPAPAVLPAHASRFDWPEGWNMSSSLPSAVNFGLLLRWEAALDELRAFRAVPEATIASFLRDFAQAIQHRLAHSPVLSPLPVPEPDRSPLGGMAGWDQIQTIFPFRLLHPETRDPLTMEQSREIQRLLQLDLGRHHEFNQGNAATLRCQLGQPVACGTHAGALRLCASARLVVEAASRGGHPVIQKALAALDKAESLVSVWQTTP